MIALPSERLTALSFGYYSVPGLAYLLVRTFVHLVPVTAFAKFDVSFFVSSVVLRVADHRIPTQQKGHSHQLPRDMPHMSHLNDQSRRQSLGSSGSPPLYPPGAYHPLPLSRQRPRRPCTTTRAESCRYPTQQSTRSTLDRDLSPHMGVMASAISS